MTEALEAARPQGKTQLGSGLAQINEVAKRRGIVFVFSDFFGDPADALTMLRQLVSKGHAVTVFHVLDGDELTFPFEGVVHFEGLELKRRLLAEPRLIRERYLAAMAAHQREIRQACLKARVRHVLVDTRRPIDHLLLSYLGANEGDTDSEVSLR